jgi:hypothetical protein
MTRPSRRVLGLALSTVIAAATVAHAEPRRERDAACPSLLACGEDLAEAERLEERIADNLHYGLALPIDYRTAERRPGDVARIAGSWGDGGIWSGSYLAAESFRYAVARAHLDDRPADDRRAWQEHLDEAKQRIAAMLAQVDLRTNISAAWRPALAPAIDPGTAPPTVRVPGAVQGEPGMLMFSCAPVDTPPGLGMDVNADVRGPWRWTPPADVPQRLTLPAGDYRCEAATSRDAYAGTLFGLLTAFDLVGRDDPEVARLIRRDVLTMADYLLRHGWNWLRPDGNLVDEHILAGSFFLTPLMTIAPTYRLGISQAALHVARNGGDAQDVLRWQAVWDEELASQGTASDPLSHLTNDPRPTGSYFGWNLAHLMYFSLVRLAANPVEASLLRRSLAAVDRQTGDDDNAFFEAVTYVLTGETSRRDAAAEHLRAWPAYRLKNDEGRPTRNTERCGTTLRCVPEDEFDVTVSSPAGDLTRTVPGSSARLRAAEPLPVADRVATDFLWQRSPFTEMDGTSDPRHQEPGIDYLLPYWMLRWSTEVAPPALQPLPIWIGPRFNGT